MNLIVVPSDDEEIKTKVLQKMYKSPEALGKGQNNFHQLVLQSYLGIKKDDVIRFLKTKPEYQMFQSSPRNVSRALRANKPLQMVAVDLMDVENLYNKRENKPYKYIFSAVDLHTGFTWYFPMRNKEASSTTQAFKDLLEYNLRFHNTETRRKMKREGKYDSIGTIISDNGKEFLGEFSQFRGVWIPGCLVSKHCFCCSADQMNKKVKSKVGEQTYNYKDINKVIVSSVVPDSIFNLKVLSKTYFNCVKSL